ncbi:MAG: FHA domain-containing protein [Gammaproteobacteria bacterium]|nr:FHA domain-containing protein [Gammaproteobacteria bacterium]
MFKIRFKDGRADAVVLASPGITIGKGDANDIVIDEAGVNGFHADIKVDGDEIVIADVGTTGGTLVNGTKIDAATRLSPGDGITIGGVELELVEDSSEERTLVLSGTALLDAGAGCWSVVHRFRAGKGPGRLPLTERIEIGRALECDISTPGSRPCRANMPKSSLWGQTSSFATWGRRTVRSSMVATPKMRPR